MKAWLTFSLRVNYLYISLLENPTTTTPLQFSLQTGTTLPVVGYDQITATGIPPNEIRGLEGKILLDALLSPLQIGLDHDVRSNREGQTSVGENRTSCYERAMKAKKATFVCLGLLVSGLPTATFASNQPQQLFLSTMATLQNLDQSVASVNTQILSGNRNRTGCGAAANGDGVAFYCKQDQKIYVSINLLSAIEKGYGPSAVRYLAAHELAHGRQHSLTGFSKDLVWSSVLDELQADCIAGAYLRLAYGRLEKLDFNRIKVDDKRHTASPKA